MPVLKDWDLRLDADAVLRGQGADPAVLRSRNMRLVDIAEKALTDGLPHVKPQILYETYKLESVSHNQIILEGGKILKGGFLVQQFAQVQEVIALVCSIGSELETQAAQLMETQMVRGLAMYGVGSAAVEALANAACSFLELEAAKRGLQTTIPLSPGMIGWSVDQGQPQIFSMLDARSIGVKLTDSYLMLPLKSLSMLIGLGANLDQQGVVCDFCASRQVCKYKSHSPNAEPGAR